MQKLKWKSNDKFTKVHLIIPQCLQNDFGRFKTDQAIIKSKKVEMEQGIQEMDVNQDNQNKLEEQLIEAQHVKTKNCL